MPLRLDTRSPDFAAAFNALLAMKREAAEDVDQLAGTIIAEVIARGDAALIAYSRKFDFVDLEKLGLRVNAGEIDAAWERCSTQALEALRFAHSRIIGFHERQLPEDLRFTDELGVELGWRWRPIEAVGLYVPGGTASYPSSVLMNAAPAKVAGVKRLVMTVPAPEGRINPLVLAAAKLAGVDEVYRVGGAQAIAALAYGTSTIASVAKIVGPGNAYVAAAKRRVFGTVGIDMIAGPSEILVIADASANADWIAMDLFAQAEHDEDAQSILLSPDIALLDAVAASIARQLPALPRAKIVAKSLAHRGALIRVRSLDEACAIANRIAPEHLELAVADPEALLPKIRNAGAIFLGHYSSEAIGDYCAGPNHVLPTARSARFSSPLGVYDFQKRTSVIAVSRAGAQTLGRVASTLARGEGLSAHAQSAEYRLQSTLIGSE